MKKITMAIIFITLIVVPAIIAAGSGDAAITDIEADIRDEIMSNPDIEYAGIESFDEIKDFILNKQDEMTDKYAQLSLQFEAFRYSFDRSHSEFEAKYKSFKSEFTELYNDAVIAMQEAKEKMDGMITDSTMPELPQQSPVIQNNETAITSRDTAAPSQNDRQPYIPTPADTGKVIAVLIAGLITLIILAYIIRAAYKVNTFLQAYNTLVRHPCNSTADMFIENVENYGGFLYVLDKAIPNTKKRTMENEYDASIFPSKELTDSDKLAIRNVLISAGIIKQQI